MIVLGIDPGTATTGYGLIKINGSKQMELIRYGLVETKKIESAASRLEVIHNELSKILSLHKPNIIAIEKLFFANNAKTAIRVGQAQGVMLLSAANHKIPVYEYSPMTIKKVVTGDGHASKLIVQKYVRKMLGSRVRKKKGGKTHFDNAADALAVAICHVYKVDLLESG